MFLTATIENIPKEIVLSLILIIVILIGILYQNNRKLISSEQEKLKLQEDLTETKLQIERFQLDNLKFQLSPHTLINSISNLTNYASKTVEGLSGLNTIMSFILYEGNQPLITLKQEWEFLKAYIKINSLKLSPLVTLKHECEIRDTDPLYNNKIIPPFLTAYFVENAFKHGDTTEDGEFYIRVNKQNNKLIYTVKNKLGIKGINYEKRNGIGQKNLSERMKIIYPNRHNIKYETENKYYISILEIELIHK